MDGEIRCLTVAVEPSPIGLLRVWTDEERRPIWLSLNELDEHRAGPGPGFLRRLGFHERRAGVLDARWRGWLATYFERGTWTAIPELPLSGGAFEHAVWRELATIPAGSTVSYGELARRCGRPEAVRAVANAVGRNPLPLFVPCHRVVAKDGLGGFRLGLEAKSWLLEHEARRTS